MAVEHAASNDVLRARSPALDVTSLRSEHTDVRARGQRCSAPRCAPMRKANHGMTASNSVRATAWYIHTHIHACIHACMYMDRKSELD